MIVRFLNPNDIEQVEQIHEKYYKDQFACPDFYDCHYLPVFCAVDDDDRIVSAGGLRGILESVLITNKDYSVRDRRQALLMMLQHSLYLAQSTKFDQIHAFIHEEDWAKQLGRYGFNKCNGTALYLPTGYKNG